MEVTRVLELTEVLISLSLLFLGKQSGGSESFVVGFVEVRPYHKNLADVLLGPQGVFALEGKRPVFDEVAGENGLDDEVQDHQLLHELDESLVGVRVNGGSEVEVVVILSVVEAQVPMLPKLPLQREQLSYLGWAYDHASIL